VFTLTEAVAKQVMAA